MRLVARETAIVWAVMAWLAGLIVGLASCAPDEVPRQHVTTTGVGL